DQVRRQTIEDRKAKFEAINTFVTSAGGWIISIPGAAEITIECTESSDLPQKLRDAGYKPEEIGRGTRLIPNATEEIIYKGEGEKRQTIRRLSHAGFVPVVRYAFTT